MSSWLEAEAQTPALLLDRARLVRNLREMSEVARANRVELFPHAKTHRMVEFGRLQLTTGADGLCVAKLGEAEELAAAGVGRIFVAFPVVGAGKARRAAELAKLVDLTLGTDSVEGARDLGVSFSAAGRRARVMLAVDSGLGREGVAPADAPDLAEAIAGLDGVELVGIFTHEGTVYDAADRAELEASARRAGELMVRTAESIRARGIPVPTVSLGSSASARVVATVPGVTQIRPGIYAVNDRTQIVLGNADLESTAIRVVATVVSSFGGYRACIDAGSKALGSDLVMASAHRAKHPGFGHVVTAPGWVIGRVSEEHGWLHWAGDGSPSPLRVGSRLEIVPNHACMVFAALGKATVLEDEQTIAVWHGMGPGSSE